MSRTWEFGDVEFRVLWERYIGGSLPRPLSFLARTPLYDDFEQEKYDTWQRLQHTVDPAVRGIFEVLKRPEVYVRLRGWYDQDQEDPQRWIKARAARSGAQGYLLRQLPGETPTHSGGYTITECGPHGLGEAIVGLMPTVPAGRGGIIPLVTDQARTADDHRPRGSMVLEEADTSVARRSTEFFETPADRTGTINILQNLSRFGPRGMRRDILVWRDLPDDGRYVIALPSAEPDATPMSEPVLIDAINASIERMMARVDSHWEASA
ncbi:ESX secretion-associated protein EspG [Nocardia sp. NPDC055053]